MARVDVPRYRGTVIGRTAVTPHLMRVRLGAVRGMTDPHLFPQPHPADGFFGLWIPGASGVREKRYYSLRRVDPVAREIDVDVVLHGHGLGSRWGEGAVIGDVVEFDEPRGHWAPPADTVSLLIAGDITALPAITRILDERGTASTTPATVIVALADLSDAQPLTLSPQDVVHWVSPRALAEATLARIGDATHDRDYVWFSGEAAQMRQIRGRLRRELRRPTSQWMTMGYWQENSERFVARLRAAGPDLARQLDAIYETDEDPHVQADRAEDLLVERGLL